MKGLRCFLPILCMASCLLLGAQTHSTKETKVILVVNTSTQTVTHIVLFNSFEKLKRQQVEEAFSNSKFYIGLLRGNYSIDDYGIKPGQGTEVVIYTNRQVFQEEPFLAGEEISLGDRIKLGNKTARIISSKKGEIMLRTH